MNVSEIVYSVVIERIDPSGTKQRRCGEMAHRPWHLEAYGCVSTEIYLSYTISKISRKTTPLKIFFQEFFKVL